MLKSDIGNSYSFIYFLTIQYSSIILLVDGDKQNEETRQELIVSFYDDCLNKEVHL